jgi:hypothetical protein
MKGYKVACDFGIYESNAFKLAEKMYAAMLETAQPAPVQQSRSDVEPVARVHTFIGPEWAVVQVLGEFNLEDELYTTPPAAQRQWVGLTENEQSLLWEISRAALPRYATYYRLVEAKLKEKNSD